MKNKLISILIMGMFLILSSNIVFAENLNVETKSGVQISDGNTPPHVPVPPTGQTESIKLGETYEYTTYTSDEDFDQIYYKFDMGVFFEDIDGIVKPLKTEWFGPYNSGETCEVELSWPETSLLDDNVIELKVKAKDDPNGDGDLSDGQETDWSFPRDITLPKTKSVSNRNDNLLFRFLEINFNGFPLLQRVLDIIIYT